jgi:hypothetical protein
MRLILLCVSFTFCLLLQPASAWAWGQNGHRIVAAIAEAHLTPEAAAMAKKILGGRSLAQVATWPDEIRSDPSWNCSKPFHFATIPPGAKYPDKGVAEGDSLQAVTYYTDQLIAQNTSARDKEIALSFVVHIIGDIHQPLHNGLGCDLGGNTVRVEYFGQSKNLHSVWDTAMLESEGLSFTEFANFLDHEKVPDAVASTSSTPVDWIKDSQKHLPGAYQCDVGKKGDGCKCYCGDCANGLSPIGGCGIQTCSIDPAAMTVKPVLKYTYKFRNLPVVREQLLAGGIHLAAHLNWVLSSAPTPPAAYKKMSDQVRALQDWDKAPGSCHGDS